MEPMPRHHSGTRSDRLPPRTKERIIPQENGADTGYYFSYAVVQLKKNNFVQDREIGISTGLSRDSLIE